MNRHAAEKRGRGAETLACWFLRLKGWRILASSRGAPASLKARWTSSHGEAER